MPTRMRKTHQTITTRRPAIGSFLRGGKRQLFVAIISVLVVVTATLIQISEATSVISSPRRRLFGVVRTSTRGISPSIRRGEDRDSTTSSASASSSSPLLLHHLSKLQEQRRRLLSKISRHGQTTEQLVSLLERLRGGAASNEDETANDDEKEAFFDAKQNESDDTDDDDGSDDKEDEEETKPSSAAASSSQPVALTVKTTVGNAVVDQSLELSVLSTRTVAALKERLRRVLPGKPPVLTLQLLHDGLTLDDDQTVQEILDEAEEDDHDDEDEDEENDEDSESSGTKVVLTLDILPPVDPKFVTHLEEKMQDLTTAQLLDAYAMNEAILYQNVALLRKAEQQEEEEEEAQAVAARGNKDDDEDQSVSSSSTIQPQQERKGPVHIQIQQEAARIREDLELLLTKGSSGSTSSSAQQQQAVELLQDDLTPAAKARQQAANPIQVRGHRTRHVTTTSASKRTTGSSYTSLRRMIQTNLNIAWGDTTRYFLLFLFFGYFGGRTPTSRAILLLGAPAVFVLQARPVKLLLKQCLYTLLDHPYGIILSLMPAPQQTMLSLNYDEAMETIYGIPAPKGKRSALSLMDDEDEDELEREERLLNSMRDNIEDADSDDEDFFDAQEDEEESDEDDDEDVSDY